jgi:hypothetical protein
MISDLAVQMLNCFVNGAQLEQNLSLQFNGNTQTLNSITRALYVLAMIFCTQILGVAQGLTHCFWVLTNYFKPCNFTAKEILFTAKARTFPESALVSLY